MHLSACDVCIFIFESLAFCLKNGEEVCIRICIVFCLFFIVCFRFCSFVFKTAKSGTINYHRKVSNDTSYFGPIIWDSNFIKNFEKVFSVSRKTRLKFLVFRLISNAVE